MALYLVAVLQCLFCFCGHVLRELARSSGNMGMMLFRSTVSLVQHEKGSRE